MVHLTMRHQDCGNIYVLIIGHVLRCRHYRRCVDWKTSILFVTGGDELYTVWDVSVEYKHIIQCPAQRTCVYYLAVWNCNRSSQRTWLSVFTLSHHTGTEWGNSQQPFLGMGRGTKCWALTLLGLELPCVGSWADSGCEWTLAGPVSPGLPPLNVWIESLDPRQIWVYCVVGFPCVPAVMTSLVPTEVRHVCRPLDGRLCNWEPEYAYRWSTTQGRDSSLDFLRKIWNL